MGISQLYIASDDEYKQRLNAKLQEEVSEFLEDQNLEELADILEVIYALCDVIGVSFEEIQKIRIEKLNKRGGFLERIILDEIK